VALGGHGSVTLLDLESGNRLASAEVDGDVYGLAAAAGRLYASTDSGHLYCFGAGRGEIGSVSYLTPTKRPFGDNELFARAAVEIVEKSGITAGYCVDLEAGDGALAFELARRTNLFIYAVEPDPAKVEVARQKLTAAGLYGSRVVVHERSPKATHYPRFFANLVVSARSISAGAASLARTEAHRLQRPYGGVVCVGHPGAMEKHVRGALAGAGKWTHQYADPANTSCSGDPVRGPLRTLWYREIQQDLTQRHGRGPAPLFSEGRLFSEGLDSLVAVDAYNGRTLWEFPLPGILRAYHGDHLMGTSGTHGNYCVTSDGIYVRREDSCLRIDPTKGKLVGEFKVPVDAREEPLTWGYIACEGGVLFGTVADPEHVVTYRFRPEGGDLNTQLTESTTFFALDARTGALKWKYDAADSIRHNAIAIGGGRVYLIDRPPALFDRVRAPRPEQRPEDAKHETGVLKAFDAVSGELVWQLTEDVYGTLLALGVESNALLMSYQPSRFRLASEFGDRLTVVNATTGERLWEKTANYGSRPTLNNGIIYAQGGAWDLLTGEEQPFSFERSYGCGTLAAGRHLLVYRSATLGYFDVDKNEKNQNFGGMRPGCWINAIPAGGLVLVPDGSAGCVCSYQNKAWMALQGSE
jgi:outer membrane protein assembly factor BamB